MDLDDTIDQLTDRIARHSPERYPVQHATAHFHLGQALLQAGRTDDAATALRTSMRWFPEGLVVERAKALNLLGAALRTKGDLDAAAEAFAGAGAVFARRKMTAEHGAALFNLGLVHSDLGNAHAAAESFAQARERFADGSLGPQAAAAVHLGKALLEAGDVDAATTTLQRAVELCERVGDREGLGAAANALGLAHLAARRPADAVEVLGLAVAAHPRSLRPAEFAMAKANLALAYEGSAQPARARLAARQALAVSEPPAPVLAQAEAVLARLGPPTGSDLLAVLDDDPKELWANTVREELVRWAAVSPSERRAEAVAWIQAQARRPEVADELIHAWLSALLELPPADLDTVVLAVLEAGDDVDPEVAAGFRSRVARAMAWFPVPQLMRLRDRFHHLAAQLGHDPTWS